MARIVSAIVCVMNELARVRRRPQRSAIETGGDFEDRGY